MNVSGKIRAHYEAFPGSPASYSGWLDKAEELWEQAGVKM